MRDLQTVVDGFSLVLEGLGVEINDHTRETAQRAAKAWYHELCSGLTSAPPKITTFESKADAMIILRDIPVKSLCAHHLLPFTGTAVVAYVPGDGKILGLSKLSRLTDYWARRPQVQEELTNDIANAIAELVLHTPTINGIRCVTQGGVGVLMRCNHFCMDMRGVKHPGDMLTSALRGVFTRPEVRDEFLRLAGY